MAPTALCLAQQLAKLLVHRDQPIPLGNSRANARSTFGSSMKPKLSWTPMMLPLCLS
jgi:hypothetical protein